MVDLWAQGHYVFLNKFILKDLSLVANTHSSIQTADNRRLVSSHLRMVSGNMQKANHSEYLSHHDDKMLDLSNLSYQGLILPHGSS